MNPAKKVLVTGGSGRVGTALIKFLLEHSYKVHSLDIVPPSTDYKTSEVTFFFRLCRFF